MIKFKKVASVLASTLLLGTTAAFAAAANYPTPFIANGAADVAVVQGHSVALTADLDAVTNIQRDLSGMVTSTGSVDAPTDGDFVKLERSATKFHLGNGILDVVSGTLTDDDLGTILADGTYLDDDNAEKDYTQKISLGNLSLTHFEDSDYKPDEPTIGFDISSSTYILNYTLDFSSYPDWADMSNTEISIMGKDYFVSSVTTNTTINLLDAAETNVINGGETKSIVIDGVPYEVAISVMDGNGVIFTVNGETTNKINTGQTYKLSDDTYIGLKDFVNPSRETDPQYAEFSIGTGKIELVHGQDVKINDDFINDLTVYLTSGSEQLQKIVLQWTADDDAFITEDSEVIMPGFENIKLSFTGMTYPSEEMFTVEKGGSTYLQISSFPLKDGPATIDLLYGNGTLFNGVGKDATHKLLTSNESSITFDKDLHEQFIATYDDGTNAESYLMRATSFVTENSVNKTTFQYFKDGGWTTKKSDAILGDTVTLGSATLTVGAIDKDAGTVVINSGSSVNFNTLYSGDGLRVMLPIEHLANNYTADAGPTHALWTNTTGAAYTAQTTFSLNLTEEDKNENKGDGTNILLTLGWTSDKPQVATIASGTSGSQEVGSSDNFRSYAYSALATEILLHTGGDQDYADVTYHGGESYANVYVTESGASTGGTSSNVMIVSDSAAPTGKNVIVVGGSCINSVAADLLGGALCGPDFTAATGVGAGSYLIQTFDWGTDNVATLVAGYNQADTANAATYLINEAPITDAGTKYTGTTATSATMATS
jgi:hypothetical protein